ncbi:histone H2A [Nephila pilipes]|uniref:Histone H2A n=1 Tax=Nephila pilipes TaxID=299642 RepID=A0A8X6P2Z4_NEPPI|nr:histone H2A [Nephila pilipes]
MVVVLITDFNLDHSNKSTQNLWIDFLWGPTLGLQKSGRGFTVARIRAMLKAKNFAQRISDTGAVFLTAVLQYLAAEILEVSLHEARTNSSRRIQPQHIHVALKSDGEFSPLFRNAVFAGNSYVDPKNIRHNNKT